MSEEIKTEKAYNYTIRYAGKRIKTKGIVTQTLQGYSMAEANREILRTAKLLRADFYEIEKEESGYKIAHFKLPPLKEMK